MVNNSKVVGRQVQVILNQEDEDLIKEAVKVSSLNLTSFIRSSAVMEARRLLKFAVTKEQKNPLYNQENRLEEIH